MRGVGVRGVSVGLVTVGCMGVRNVITTPVRTVVIICSAELVASPIRRKPFIDKMIEHTALVPAKMKSLYMGDTTVATVATKFATKSTRTVAFVCTR